MICDWCFLKGVAFFKFVYCLLKYVVTWVWKSVGKSPVSGRWSMIVCWQCGRWSGVVGVRCDVCASVGRMFIGGGRLVNDGCSVHLQSGP